MTKTDSFLFFLVSWITFLLIGFIVGNIILIIPSNYWAYFIYVSPIFNLVISYWLIWKFLIKNKYSFFESSDFKGFSDSYIIPIFLLVIGIQIIEQPFIDIYNKTFFPELNDILHKMRPNFKIDLLFSSITAVIIAPIFEELLFRKIIFKQLLSKNSVAISVLLSSLFFAIIHLPLYGKLIPSFFIGICSALIYYKTGKIIYSIVFHFTNNLLAMVWSYYLPEFWNNYTEMEFNYQYWLIFGLGIILLLMGIKLFLKNLEKSRENL